MMEGIMGTFKVTRIIMLTFIILAFLIPNICAAAPSISGYSGTVTHGQTITVTGSGFGTKSPVAPLLWDTVGNQSAYSGLTSGTFIMNATGAAVSSSYPWPGVSGSSDLACSAAYSTVNLRGKTTANYSNRWYAAAASRCSSCGCSAGAGAVGGKNFTSSGTRKLYISWWMYSDRDMHNTGSSNKFYRLTTNGNYQDTQVVWEPDKLNIYDSVAKNNILTTWKSYTSIATATGWNRFSTYVDNTSSPRAKIVRHINNTLFDSVNPSTAISVDIMGVYAIGANWSNAQTSGVPLVDFGEIYIDSTLARLEVCNASTFSSSTHCEIQIPTTQWVDGQLQLQVNQGSFADGATAYLYVIDAAGNASAGKQITFGSSSVAPASSIPMAPVAY
jgi:hypothetical protein